jgi:hypothetical protein
MAKRDHAFIIALVREICGLLRKSVPWVAGCFMAWCVVLIFRELAGKLTIAQIDVLVGFFAKVSSPVYPWTVAIGAIGYGHLQRRERRRKTESLQRRIVELEQRIDPTRTSSQLEADGSTREEDRL